MFTVTVQLLEPETETLRLYQLFPTVPADSVAVQPPENERDGVGQQHGSTVAEQLQPTDVGGTVQCEPQRDGAGEIRIFWAGEQDY